MRTHLCLHKAAVQVPHQALRRFRIVEESPFRRTHALGVIKAQKIKVQRVSKLCVLINKTPYVVIL